jgi:Replication-relaxation
MTELKQTRPLKILSPRNLDVLYSVARFRLCSTKQLYQLHFAESGALDTSCATLLARLEGRGYLQRTYTYGRSTQTALGLSKTRPDSVWYFPPACQKQLQDDLSKLGRLSEFDRFQDHIHVYNKDQSFSDQVLPHELGLTSCLMALEAHVAARSDIADFFWIRTSPQHKITSTRVHYLGADSARTRAINPDAVVFFKVWDGEVMRPNFFYLEYETGTADAYKYRDQKVIPYREYVYQAREHNLRHAETRYFAEVAVGILERWGIEVPKNYIPAFRVLTISSHPEDSKKLFSVSTAVPSKALFLFTDLATFLSDPLGPIWMRKQEFEEAGLLAEFESKEWLVAEQRILPSVLRTWLSEVLDSKLERVGLV